MSFRRQSPVNVYLSRILLIKHMYDTYIPSTHATRCWIKIKEKENNKKTKS